MHATSLSMCGLACVADVFIPPPLACPPARRWPPPHSHPPSAPAWNSWASHIQALHSTVGLHIAWAVRRVRPVERRHQHPLFDVNLFSFSQPQQLAVASSTHLATSAVSQFAALAQISRPIRSCSPLRRLWASRTTLTFVPCAGRQGLSRRAPQHTPVAPPSSRRLPLAGSTDHSFASSLFQQATPTSNAAIRFATIALSTTPRSLHLHSIGTLGESRPPPPTLRCPPYSTMTIRTLSSDLYPSRPTRSRQWL